ncbi:DUF6627 family protein [Photobacterium sp.]|uniref:DUF6627 family protein n=1 Tax=Photobacterium sp. TaxID=660 RepID=UPI00299EC211|nr:DUF6627 family protein [Photobacterium sp.]MDX1303083.1 DUF6627 family protein [Photobacterium sp.]
MKKSQKILASILIMLISMVQIPMVQAAIITTDEAIQVQQNDINREYILSMLQKDELQQHLADYGLDAQLAAERVSHMSDAEIALLNERLNEMPAGEGVVGTIVLIFIVFIITDALGATDIFPFVKPINR